MKIILKSLKLGSFKKLTGEWYFEPGKNVFLGENGTGKTTIVDAERWLRTSKNSLGNAKFDIKTIINKRKALNFDDPNPFRMPDTHPTGRVTPNVIPYASVVGVYEIDGKELTLERVYSEKWPKTRGKLEAEFVGHTTTYCVDKKANTSKKVFDAKVNEVFGGEPFQLVSDPAYFAGLKWERRREILADMAGEIDKDSLIDQIAGFREMLGDLTVKDKKEIAAESKRKINDELKTLPARIDEHNRQLLIIAGGITEEESEKKIAEAKEAVRSAQKTIDDFKIGKNEGTVNELKKLNQSHRDAVVLFEREKTRARVKFNATRDKFNKIVSRIRDKGISIGNRADRIAELKEIYKKVKTGEFQKKDNACRFCGVVIACPHCAENDEDGEKQFNKNKSERLLAINKDGAELVAANKITKQELVELEKEKKEIETVDKPAILSEIENDEIAGLLKEIKTLEDKKATVKMPPEYNLRLEEAKNEQEADFESLSMIRSNSESKKRVEELNKRMTDLSREFDEIEKFLFLLDKYNKKLAESTESQVNGWFEYVRFRMFNTQVNGAIVPVCDIMNKESRAYETALSAGERVRAGLDIIKTFSKHYGIRAPVFIDGAESVTTTPELDSQTIELRAIRLLKCASCDKIFSETHQKWAENIQKRDRNLPISCCPYCESTSFNEHKKLTQI